MADACGILLISPPIKTQWVLVGDFDAPKHRCFRRRVEHSNKRPFVARPYCIPFAFFAESAFQI